MRKKTIALIFFGITLVGLIVLAAGISRLEFQPGERFSLPGREEPTGEEALESEWVDVVLIIARIFLGMSVVLLPFYLLYLLFSKQGRQDLLLLLPKLAVFLLIVLIISRLPMTGWFDEVVLNGNGSEAGNGIGEPAPIAEFASDPPSWVINLVGVLLALVIAAIATTVVLNRKRKPVEQHPYERLADEAEEAIRDLYAGKDLRETIVRCYRDMSQVLDQERGIRRGSDMTTHEFEALLQSKGLPGESIHELTRLFEEVRYSKNTLSTADERRAISSLSAIITALRSEG